MPDKEHPFCNQQPSSTPHLILHRDTIVGWVRLQKARQTILKTTHLLSSAEIFGANTPFSAHLHNHLTISTLSHKSFIQLSTSVLQPCKTCLTAVRNMANRDSKHGLSHLSLACLATRKLPNRRRFCHFSHQILAKITFSHACSLETPH